MNKAGAIAGMVVGIVFTALYIFYFKFWHPELNNANHWWFGVSPEGIGTLGMIFNVVVSMIVAHLTPAPPANVQDLVEDIRYPRGAGTSSAAH
jgi:cation/acetate symporter